MNATRSQQYFLATTEIPNTTFSGAHKARSKLHRYRLPLCLGQPIHSSLTSATEKNSLIPTAAGSYELSQPRVLNPSQTLESSRGSNMLLSVTLNRFA